MTRLGSTIELQQGTGVAYRQAVVPGIYLQGLLKGLQAGLAFAALDHEAGAGEEKICLLRVFFKEFIELRLGLLQATGLAKSEGVAVTGSRFVIILSGSKELLVISHVMWLPGCRAEFFADEVIFEAVSILPVRIALGAGTGIGDP